MILGGGPCSQSVRQSNIDLTIYCFASCSLKTNALKIRAFFNFDIETNNPCGINTISGHYPSNYIERAWLPFCKVFITIKFCNNSSTPLHEFILGRLFCTISFFENREGIPFLMVWNCVIRYESEKQEMHCWFITSSLSVRKKLESDQPFDFCSA